MFTILFPTYIYIYNFVFNPKIECNIVPQTEINSEYITRASMSVHNLILTSNVLQKQKYPAEFVSQKQNKFL